MRRRHHLIWYRPGDGRPREFFVSPGILRFLVVVGGVVLTALVLGGVLYTSLVERAIERDQLLEENERLRREVARVDIVATQLGELQQFGQQVKRSLTEGADLERILEAGEAVEREMPSGLDVNPWVKAPQGKGEGSANPFGMLQPASVHEGIEFPNRWPLEGFITREYVASPVDPAQAHTGIDLAVPRGTPVRAVSAGVVVAADWTPRYGYRVILDHGGGMLSMYGHNELLLVHPGDWVQSGAPIALSGNSGISTAPHLHLEMWVSGQPVDPRALLPKRGDDNGDQQAN